MKKLLKIMAIVLPALLLVLAIAPFAFRGKIRQAVIAQADRMLDARVDFGALNVSLLRDFPRASISLREVSVVGVGRFEGDTLLSVGRLGATVNLASLFSDKGYEVSRVEIERTLLSAIILEDSTANWQIVKGAEADTAPAGEASDFRVQLKRLTISDLRLRYDDRTSKLAAAVGGLDARLSGDLSASRSALHLQADARGIDLRQGGVAWLSQAGLRADIAVDADLEAQRFVLKDNELSLNAILLELDGWLDIEQQATDMELTFSTPQIDFKQLLSLVPAIYANDFASVQAGGRVALGGWAKGRLEGERLPAFELQLSVDEGSLRYPDLPQSVDDIRITARIANPGGTADATEVKIDPMSLRMAGNPLTIKAVVTTPVSDPAFDASAHGVLDLGKIGEVYPLGEGIQLGGVIDADVALRGRLSQIEAQQYDRIAASGCVTLNDLVLKRSDTPDIDIRHSKLTFSPRYLDLTQTDIVIGRNDLQVAGRVENYIGYALRGTPLLGSMNLHSSYLNANDLLSAQPAADTASAAPMGLIEVPRNLHLDLTADVSTLVYGNLTLEQLAGRVAVADGVAQLRNLSMKTLDGAVDLRGSYSTAADATRPEFAADLALSGLSFARLFESFVTIRSLVPLFESLEGNFSGRFDLSTTLDETMTPILSTLDGSGSIQTRDISLSKIGAISRLLELAEIGGIGQGQVKDLKVDFAITDGKVATRPFDIRLGEAVMTLSGTTSLDRTIDYTGRLQLPPAAAAAMRVQHVGIRIGGSFADPQVSLDTKAIAAELATSALTEVGARLGVDLSDATTQKEALVAAAQRSGEAIMAEARKQADALVEAAKNPLAKVAAQAAADRLIREAQRQVDQGVAKATAQGDSLIVRAQRTLGQ